MFFFYIIQGLGKRCNITWGTLKNTNSEATAYLYIYKSIYIFSSDYLKFSLFFNNLGRKKTIEYSTQQYVSGTHLYTMG